MDGDALATVARALAREGIELAPGALTRLARYQDLVLDANTRINLVSRASSQDFEVRHLLDCLTTLPTIDAIDPSTLVDIGSGAGLPGLIIALARPSIQVTLIESIGKKGGFLRQATAALQADNVRVVVARAEAAGRDPDLGGRFDCLTARGIAPLARLAALASPLLRVGGCALLMKGPLGEQELAEARAVAERFGFDEPAVNRVAWPELAARCMVTWHKHAWVTTPPHRPVNPRRRHRAGRAAAPASQAGPRRVG